MAKDKTQLLRLIAIDRAIRDGMQRGVLANCTSMAAAYEVSTKTILRDIDYLKNQRDAPIAYDPVRRGYYYTEARYQLPAISLNESDLFALCIAEKALRQHENTPVYDKLAAVFRKIEESLPERVSVQPAWVDERLTVIEEHHTRIDPAVWEAVTEGLHANRRLELAYQKPGAGEATARQVDPYHVVRYQGEWYLVGHCHLRRGLRTFAMSRIRRAAAGKERFTLPPDFDFAAYRAKRFGIFGGEREYAVRLYFAPRHAPYLLERRWHPEQQVARCDDGGVELAFPSTHLAEVIRWVLSWGSGVRVLAPEELAAAVQGELAAMVEDHGPAGGQVPGRAAGNSDAA